MFVPPLAASARPTKKKGRMSPLSSVELAVTGESTGPASSRFVLITKPRPIVRQLHHVKQ